MFAFVPSLSLFGGRRVQNAASACRRPARLNNVAATPFFASSAFGTPMPTCVHLPQPVAPAPNLGAPFMLPRMEVTIVVGENEPVESALRRFKRDVAKSGHLFELRRRRYFETNTEKRIRKAAASRRKAKLARMMKNNRNRNKNK